MATHVLVVHGVGPFNQLTTEQKIRELLSNVISKPFSLGTVSSLDWCSMVGSPFPRMASLAKAFLELVHVDSLQEDTPRKRRIVSATDIVLLLSQLLSLALVPVLLAWLVLGSRSLLIGYFLVTLALPICAVVVEVLSSGSVQLSRLARRFAFIWVWPILHTIAVPVSLSVFGLSLIKQSVKLCAYLFSYAVGSALLVGIAGLLVSHGGDSLSGSGAALIIAMIAAILVAAAAVAGVSAATIYVVPRLLAYFPLKDVCDIELWLHDSNYRASLRDALSRKITALRLEKNDVLVLVTHSLGSIIALDYMVSPESLPRNYVLITLGSPLRSLLGRFFPELFSIPGSLCQFLAARNPHFEWINVFRPFDPIGRALGIGGTRHGCEMSTGQKTKFHLNYWSDSRVLECIKVCIEKLREQPYTQGVPDTGPGLVWVPLRRSIRFTPIARFWEKGATIAGFTIVIAALVSTWAGWVFSTRRILLNPQRNFDKLVSKGTSFVVPATCDLRADFRSELNSLHPRYLGSCEMPFGGKEHPKKVEIPLTSLPGAPLGCKGYACNASCQVKVRYDPNAPDNYIIQSVVSQKGVSPGILGDDVCHHLPADVRPEYSAWDVFMVAVCTLAFGALSVYVWKNTGLVWFSSLLGVNTSDSWMPFEKIVSRMRS